MLVADHEWKSCCPSATVALDYDTVAAKCRVSAYGLKINLNALFLLRARPMRPWSQAVRHRLPVGSTQAACSARLCAARTSIRLANPWACFHATTRLGSCSLLLSLPACIGTPFRAGHGLALSAQRTRPQRIVQSHGRTARVVAPVAPAVTEVDQKERLFRAFVEWQGTQDNDH